MSPQPQCVICHTAAHVYDPGTTTPGQFFSSEVSYTIAAGHNQQRLPLYACQVCGHGFTPIDIDFSIITNWYGRNKPDTVFLSNEAARRKTARIILQRIQTHTGKVGRLLDIGAGPGIFVSEAIRAGWDAIGIDPSAWAIRHARDAYGVVIQQGDIDQLSSLPAISFNVVTLFDVIEHVPNPDALLKAVTRLLRPGGFLVLTTPRFDSALARLMGRRWYCIFPAHIQYFTRRSLQLAAQTAGLKIVEERTHTRYLNMYYLWQRLKAFTTGTRISSPLHTTGPIIPVNYGDEFEVYAQKHTY